MRSLDYCLLMLLCAGIAGCGSGSGKPAAADAAKGAHRDASLAVARFNRKDFKETLTWVKSVQKRLDGIDNPLVLKEGIERESKEFEKVNGTSVEWQFPVTSLGSYGETPYVTFDGQKMNYRERVAVVFRGGEYGDDAGRVFLKVGKHVSKDRYRGLKEGSPATVKGTVRINFSENTSFVVIIIENTTMN